MGRIGNAWNLAKASWAVLSRDRELVALPVIAGIAGVVAFGLIAAPGMLLANNQAEGASNLASLIVLFTAVVVGSWILAIGQAAVIAGAAERMDGGDPSIGSSYAAVRSCTGRLFQWALMATVVSVVLDQLEQRLGILGRILSWVGSIAFSVMSFLALPIIIFENVGAIEGFKRSSTLLRNTWGEQVTFNFGSGLLGLVAMLPGVLVAVVLVASGSTILAGVGVVLAVGWVALVASVTSALSAVFKCALYRWAKGLPVDPTFDATTLGAAFVPKGR